MPRTRRSRTPTRTKQRRPVVKGECIIPPPVPVEVLPQFTLNTPARK
jgi:hypothetical protein